MHVTGIICEFNPLHLGHAALLRAARENGAVVCLMSGSFVQRGAPAVFDKTLRAKAAVACGADLVLELPVTASLSSAEGFAAQGVRLLLPLCDTLCFGAENADASALMRTAHALLDPAFPQALHAQLARGLSFPAARQAAVQEMGLDDSLLVKPNNILAVEYCKAILAQSAPLTIAPVARAGDYNAATPDPEHSSATAVRACIEQGLPWAAFVPPQAAQVFASARVHTLQAGERAILARLRTMDDAQFAELPYGSEGLWRKLMHAARREASVEAILTAAKSKRYTRSRLNRMVLCAFLGITRRDIDTPAPYARVLAFNDTGRSLLHTVRDTLVYCNAGQDTQHPYQALERRCGDLYGLFACGEPDAPNAEASRRVAYFPLSSARDVL